MSCFVSGFRPVLRFPNWAILLDSGSLERSQPTENRQPAHSPHIGRRVAIVLEDGWCKRLFFAFGAVMVFAGVTSLLRPSVLVVATTIANLGISLAPAQGQINEVHIKPRAEMSTPEAPANLLSSALDTHTEQIRKQVDLVLVPVTVTDPWDRIVTGLDSCNFELYEGKHRQEIRHFSTEDAPLSLGILFDVSGSMKNKIERAREAVVEFLRAANQQDEFFMITFADRPQLLPALHRRWRGCAPAGTPRRPQGPNRTAGRDLPGTCRNAAGKVSAPSLVGHFRWRG
jgi:hypothetical protein